MVTYSIDDVIREAEAALARSDIEPFTKPKKIGHPYLLKFETCLPDEYQKVASFFNYQESAILAWLYAWDEKIGVRPLESLHTGDLITVANAVFWLTDQ